MRRSGPAGAAALDTRRRLQPDELQPDEVGPGHLPDVSAGLSGRTKTDATAANADDLEKLLAALERDRSVFVSDAQRAAAVSLARRAEDFELRNDLALAGFAGPHYDLFVAELIAYGFPVLMLWMRTGQIFPLCAAKGRHLGPTDEDRLALQQERDEREELAYETLAEGIRFFRNRALVNGGWTMEGGASLKTYFVGGLLYSFPNVFRRWANERKAWTRLVRYERPDHVQNLPLPGSEDRPGEDPARVAMERDTLRQYLRPLTPTQRRLVALTMHDYPQAEIGRTLHITERAVEGRLHRLRQSLRAARSPRAAGANEGGQP